MNEFERPGRHATEGSLLVDGTPLGEVQRDLVMRFESLGGAGHGCEFGLFQRHYGAEPLGLLRWADLDHNLLCDALESRFEGVGLPENTILFMPENSDEWWTKDTRYWMAMRSFVKVADVGFDQMTRRVCRRLQFLRQKILEDLGTGEKILVFKNMQRNLSGKELARLHQAIRSYGASTLFYVRYADAQHPPGTVEATAPGLLIGYIDHFAFSPDDKPLGMVHQAWYDLCERAWRLLCPEEQDHSPAVTMPSIGGHRGRRIVLIGNCQAQAMGQLYTRFVAGRSGDTINYIASYQDVNDDNRQAIENADVVVEQLFDLSQQADTSTLATRVERLHMPMVTAAFLWPFAGSPHPRNEDHPFLVGGPYGGEASDSYLNRLIAAGTDPVEAVELYANLDVNKRVNLDRLFELVMDRQRARDAAAGYQIADVMERYFRTEQIFLSPYHPNTRIAVTLAEQLFHQLGAHRSEIELMRHCTRITPFPKTELPLHPSVCAHYGLAFVAPDRRYRFMNEGLFTFREYALRYMRYEWNQALEEGMSLAHAGQIAQAKPRLIAGLMQSPDSAQGHVTLSHVHGRLGANEDALKEARQAVAIEPQTASFHAHLGALLRQSGQFDAAADHIGTAVAIDPVEPHNHIIMAHLQRERGELDAACDHLRIAVSLDPYNPNLRAELADFLEAKGDTDGAFDAIRAASKLSPDNPALQSRLTDMLGRMNRLDDAVAAARAAVAMNPAAAGLHVTLSTLLLKDGNGAEALTEAYAAVVCDPLSAAPYAHLGQVLRTIQDLTGAEAAFRQAAEMEPRNAHFQHEVSDVLNQLDKVPAAIEAARAATMLEPGNPHRYVHLAGLMARGNDLAGATMAQRRAVALDSASIPFRVGLSDLLARQGALTDALTEAEAAVANDPASAHALGHLAHILRLNGALHAAETTFLRALAISPDNAHLQAQIAVVRERMARAQTV